ncbi:hypothetical protein L1887_63336 [Cichorium endivia]|nr:hypothetical protein L1887_63336 [Cichorium endivia]
MRLLSILMSRFKSYTIALLSQSKSPSKSSSKEDAKTSGSIVIGRDRRQQETASFSLPCAKETVKILAQSDLIDISLKVLNALLKYWTEYQQVFEEHALAKTNRAATRTARPLCNCRNHH